MAGSLPAPLASRGAVPGPVRVRSARSGRCVIVIRNRAIVGKGSSMTTVERRLVFLKFLHTVVWAFFAACVLAIPPLVWLGRLEAAAWLAGAVLLESLVLAFNRWTCPITPLAARLTEDRRDNFDIYLPEWLARHNKTIFGALYLAGLALLLVRWLS